MNGQTRLSYGFMGLAAVILAAVTLLAYHSVAGHALIYWDDQRFILENIHIRGLTPADLAWMFTEIRLDLWHPFTWLSYAVTYFYHGLEAMPYHVFNLLIHAANSVWWFGLAAVLLKAAGNAGMLRVWGVAFLAALLFAVHPQHVESVAWASERKDVLSLFFLFPMLLTYVFYTRSTRHRYFWYGLSLVCFILALMSKTMVVTFPVVLLLLDAYPLQRWPVHKLSALLIEKLPFFALILLPIGLTLWGQHQAEFMPDLGRIDMQLRLLNAANSVVLYISKWLFPVHLAPFYPFPAYTLPQALLPVAVIALVTLLAAYAWYRGQRIWLTAWLYYLVTLSPVVGIIQVGSQAAADRYAYLTTLPFYLLAAVGMVQLYQRLPARRLRVVALALVLGLTGILAYATHRQSGVWRDSLTLWRYAVVCAPDSHVTQGNLAAEYLRQQDYHQAITHYRFAIGLAPREFTNHYNIAVAYIYTGQWDAALASYRYILDNQLNARDGLPQIYASMGWIYRQQGKPELAREAIRQALELDPGHGYAQRLWDEMTSRQNGLSFGARPSDRERKQDTRPE